MKVLYLHTNGDKTTNLIETLDVLGNVCCVVNVQGKIDGIPSTTEPLYLCSNITQDVIVNDTKLPALCQFKPNSKGFVDFKCDSLIWLDVRHHFLSHVHLYISNENGDILSFGGRGLYCTLLIK